MCGSRPGCAAIALASGTPARVLGPHAAALPAARGHADRRHPGLPCARRPGERCAHRPRGATCRLHPMPRRRRCASGRPSPASGAHRCSGQARRPRAPAARRRPRPTRRPPAGHWRGGAAGRGPSSAAVAPPRSARPSTPGGLPLDPHGAAQEVDALDAEREQPADPEPATGSSGRRRPSWRRSTPAAGAGSPRRGRDGASHPCPVPVPRTWTSHR
jgi:hypothetical protein